MNYAWKDPDEFKLDEAATGDDPASRSRGPDQREDRGDEEEDPELRDRALRRRRQEGLEQGSLRHAGSADDWQTYLDLNSAVDYYLSREFTKDNDADFYRSNFFYTNNVDPNSVDPTTRDPTSSSWGRSGTSIAAPARHEPFGDHRRRPPAGGCAATAPEPRHEQDPLVHPDHQGPAVPEGLADRWAAKKARVRRRSAPGVSRAVTKLGGSDSYDLGSRSRPTTVGLGGVGGRYHPHRRRTPGEITWVSNWFADRYTWMDNELVKATPPIPE